MTPNCIEEFLQAAIGLDASTIGAAAIERSVHLRMRRSGLQSAEEYWRRLQDCAEERQALIEDVVVPETWFFRCPASFDALARIVMRDWAPTHETGLLRVLSIPCATGEEPYSIAISLLEAGLSTNRFTIDALDVSRKALSKALQAQYRPISFRNDGLNSREHYFDRTQNHYYVVERVRRQVRFHHGNLLAPDLLQGEEAYDCIFCRNVLIYFDRDTQGRTLQMMERMLTPGGILFVGSAESGVALTAGCTPVDSPASFAFRFLDAVPERRPKPVRSRPADKTPTLRRAPPPKSVVATSAPPPCASEPARPGPRPDLDAAARSADAGRLEEAAAICQSHLLEAGPSAAAYFLLGVINDALGDVDQAVDYYRKAHYLEPEHSESLLHLALAREKQGDLTGARRLRERARRGVQRGD